MDERTFHSRAAYTLCGFMLFAFVLLHGLKITAPYGRFTPAGTLAINSSLAWFLQELPSLLVASLCWYWCDTALPVANLVLISFFIGHYINRTLVFPLLIRGGKGTGLPTFFAAVFFTAVNGYIMGRSVTHFDIHSDDHHTTPQFIGGALLFAAGVAINLHSDHILRNLRRPGEVGYKIPYGGAFEFVTAANYFGEMLEWIGFAIAADLSIVPVIFAINTICNLLPRALQYHQWYQEKFEDYPKHRCALIPFIL
eukprot:TRINITY_DN2380_c1_g1_i3.p1 TRINITY_DN2380_c1_g1~~TRINITY_DN2380_c1_g1_i3.p1  ORF type:complete len:277 (+),score=99.31 TRINITY_DN2380_c1_g1_i3:72-833(+)